MIKESTVKDLRSMSHVMKKTILGIKSYGIETHKLASLSKCREINGVSEMS